MPPSIAVAAKLSSCGFDWNKSHPFPRVLSEITERAHKLLRLWSEDGLYAKPERATMRVRCYKTPKSYCSQAELKHNCSRAKFGRMKPQR